MTLSIPRDSVRVSAKEAGPNGGRQDLEIYAELLLSRTFSNVGRREYHFLNKNGKPVVELLR